MSDTKSKALDLDELFGEARAVKIRWQSKEYELMRLEALGPKSISRFQKLQKMSSQLHMESLTDEITEEQDQQIQNLFDEMLSMLCKDLPVVLMPFAHKSKALEFYIVETQGKNALDIAQTRKGKRTGAMSTQS